MKETAPTFSLGLAMAMLLLFFPTTLLHAQFIATDVTTQKIVSLHPYASLVDVGQHNYTLEDILDAPALAFQPLRANQDLGFTTHHYWVKFEVYNATQHELTPFIETCRPIVDVAELYVIRPHRQPEVLKSGDLIPFEQRALANHKTLFSVSLPPKTLTQFYLHLKSDGETINVPLYLKSGESELALVSFEQFVFGVFYGILFLAAIIYMFFFFGLKERSFLYYSLYVAFIGLLQYSVDGYFHQYFAPDNTWLSVHCVLINATFANFFLGMYAITFLKIKQYSKFICRLFYGLFVLDFLSLVSLIVIQDHHYLYPVANILGLFLLVLIISSVVVVYRQTRKIDGFFTLGVMFLIAGFVVFILKNFGALPSVFWTENSSKLGTGLEVIFLSLSMANLIRNLKNEREELQTLALQRSEEMNELKSYFLSNISHELRTPLNAILNTAKNIASETTDAQIKNDSQIIKYSTYSLLNSINDILDFSKIEKNEIKLELAPFDLIKMTEHIAANYAKEVSDKGLSFSFQLGEDLPAQVIGDAARLSQILQNVMSNAIKFTHEGFVKFKVDAKKEKGNRVTIIFTVSDTGVGISKEKIHSIYDSFSQEGISNKRKFGGLGLGLYIVKHLVDLHQGKITMDSTTGLGTVCEIQLSYEPVAVAAVVAEAQAATLEYDLKGKSILVVEDNAMNQMVIKMMTKKWLNTTVEFANNGQEGVQKLTEKHFDIILMDLQMPIMDGYEATIAIRNGEAGENKKSIPIIALTADVMESTKTRVIEIGMNKYLSKPVDKDMLFEIIKHLV